MKKSKELTEFRTWVPPESSVGGQPYRHGVLVEVAVDGGQY